MKKTFLTIVVVFSATLISITALTIYYTEVITKNLEKDFFENKISDAKIAGSDAESFFNKIIISLEISSKRPEVRSLDYANQISDEHKGIPQDADLPKRKTAQEILGKVPVLDTISFVLPNGDMYLTEPYTNQQLLTQLNWAERDWFKGTVSGLKPYISEVYNATATRQYAVSVNVPVFSDADEFIGIWRGVVSLDKLYSSNSMQPKHSEHLVFVDHHGNELPVALGISEGVVKSLSEIQSVKNALSGEEGILEEFVDGKKMLISYSPVQVPPHVWAVLLIEPSDAALAPINSIKLQSMGLISFIALTLVLSAYFYYRNLKINITLLEKLKETDRLKEEFSAMITHELKTPLVPIIGYCKMLKNQMLGKLTSDQQDSIETMEKNAKRLESLINDIMDARKLDLDKMRFDIQEISVDEFFENLDSSYREVLKETRKEFTTKLLTKGLTIKTDKTRLRQVFDNLMSNAIKFTPEKDAKIEVGAKKENNKMIFYVKDNGIGIPPEKQSSLFKKFYQIDTSQRRKAGGTGLGLAISKGIIEKLDGRIWVESDGKTGSTFYFEIPL